MGTFGLGKPLSANESLKALDVRTAPVYAPAPSAERESTKPSESHGGVDRRVKDAHAQAGGTNHQPLRMGLSMVPPLQLPAPAVSMPTSNSLRVRNSSGTVTQDGIPERTMMLRCILCIRKRAQTGYVLRQDSRRAGLVSKLWPRRVPRSVRIAGAREVRPERHHVVRKRSLARV